MSVEAGQGDHHVYTIPDPSASTSDSEYLAAGKHYLGIDAVSWFLNKESGFFSTQMASGTLGINLSGGENYHIALGTFELEDGARMAPVFDKSVLPDRNFRGGTVGIRASLTTTKQDNALGRLLKSAASASLGVAAGMVQTATRAGPASLLAAAGSDLIGGVRDALAESGRHTEAIFQGAGIEKTFQAAEIIGPTSYVLLHRGTLLEERHLRLGQAGELLHPQYKGAMLEDGAWLLLRLRRSSVYSGVRPWQDDAKKLRQDLDSLVGDVAAGFLDKDDALGRLKPGGAEDSPYNRYVALRALISADGVLSEDEALYFLRKLRTDVVSAKRHILEGTQPASPDAPRALRLVAESRSPAEPSAAALREDVRILRAVRGTERLATAEPELLAAYRHIAALKAPGS